MAKSTFLSLFLHVTFGVLYFKKKKEKKKNESCSGLPWYIIQLYLGIFHPDIGAHILQGIEIFSDINGVFGMCVCVERQCCCLYFGVLALEPYLYLYARKL